jgi:putative phosphoesterase
VRLAIVSDIHANLTALEAVVADLRRVSPDLIVHGGDLVGSGARPAEVVDRICELEWPGVYGNSDEMVWNEARVEEMFAAPSLDKWRGVVVRAATATCDGLGDKRIDRLRALPLCHAVEDVVIVHAGPADCWRSPTMESTDEELRDGYAPLQSRMVVYGHIHRPYIRRLPSLAVANSGSVSLSHDGDPRAAYVVIDGDAITITRVEYDIAREVIALMNSACPDAEWIAHILRSGSPLPPG